MEGSPPLPSLPLPAPPPADWVMDDLPCRSCGYNLRTQGVNGICPECATPVRVSMRGELLREADPNWAWWLNAACKLIVVGSFVSLISLFSRGSTWNLAVIAGSAALTLGSWLIASPDPSGIGEDRYGGLRGWVRALGIVQFGASLGKTLTFSTIKDVTIAISLSSIVTRCAWEIVLFWYLMRLATRVGDPGMVLKMRVGLILACMFSAGLVLAWGVPYFADRRMAIAARGMGNAFALFNMIWLYGRLFHFAGAVKAEFASAERREKQHGQGNVIGYSPWRITGRSLYLATQIFRRKNGSEKEQ